MSADVRQFYGQVPLTEGFLLPVTSVLASAGVAAVALRLMALATGMTTGWLAYAAIFVAGAIGTAATALRGVLDLPRAMRILDFLGALLIGAILLYLGPQVAGVLHVGGRAQPVSLLSVGLVSVVIAWAFATSMSWVVVTVYPVESVQPTSEEVAERLQERVRMREVYGRQGFFVANVESWRNAQQVVLAIFLMYLIVTLIWTPVRESRSDLLLSGWTSLAFCGLLSFLALVHLASARRADERMRDAVVLPGYGRAWAAAVLLPAAVVGLICLALPSDISPLAYVDWNAVMTDFTQWLVGWAFAPVPRRRFFAGMVAGDRAGQLGHAPVVYGGSGGSGMVGLLMVLAIPLGLYVIWQAIRRMRGFGEYAFLEERARTRGLRAILWAIISWPWRALKTLWRRSSPQMGDRRQKEVDESIRARRRGRRRGARLHPEDPGMFVRYVYGRMLRSASQVGLERPRNQTALEFAQGLADQLPGTAEPVEELTATYCQVRYTTRQPDESIKARSLNLLRSVTRGFRSARRDKAGKE